MTVPKIASPNPSIFTSDPLEQIFAKGVLDRDMSGLSYMFMNAAGAKRDAQGDRYMQSLKDSNALANALAKYEAEQELVKEHTKIAGGLVKEGFSPRSVTGGENLLADDNIMTKLIQEELRTRALKNANSGSGGGGTKDKTVVQQQVAGWGAPGFTTVTSTSSSPDKAHANANAAVQNVYNDMKTNPNKYTAAQKAEIVDMMKQASTARYPGAIEQ